jgi:hypothetical protein
MNFPFPHTEYRRQEVDFSSVSIYEWNDEYTSRGKMKYKYIPRPQRLPVACFEDPSLILVFYGSMDNLTMLWKYKNRYYGYQIQGWSDGDFVLFHELRMKGVSVDKAIEYMLL